jgi:hypothetical protein
MFGLNDNNQNDSSQKPADKPDAPSAPTLPASPFLNEPASTDTPVATPPSISEEPAALPASAPAPTPNEDALIGLKQQALSSLSPLVNHLEQTPEEKFKTMMMLIQASDNSNLIKEAYEAANQITDEKARAQALLDVINEINYFTQKDTKAKS